MGGFCICEKTGKRIFPDELTAWNAVGLIQRKYLKKRRGNRILFVYECEHCKAYHLTRQVPGKDVISLFKEK